MAHPELSAEQAHVDHAYERLEAMRAAAAEMLAEAFGERGGTFQSFTERDIRVRTSLSRLEHLQIGRESLVFGRIDAAIDNAHQNGAEPSGPTASGVDAGTEAFHIGRLAISDASQDPLVVDWRAPVAEPFYRATGAHTMGLRRRRHFLTEGRAVVDLEDELFDFDGSNDGTSLGLSGSQVLLAALSRGRSGRMRDIVATVQREQDEVIRGPLGGVLVVQGGPGTGKTAVALHRAAYLLYTHRFPLESQGVLVVGPNPTFLRYIEHVLPSLGESGVELSTISGLYADARPTATEPEPTSRLKGDARMARLLARAVGDRQRPLRRRLEIPYGRALLRLTPEASAQVVAGAKRRPGSHNARRRTVETLLWRHLLIEVERRVGRPDGPTENGADPAGDALTATELGRELRRLPEVVEALDRMWPVLTPEELLHDLFGARPLIDLAGRTFFDDADRSRLERPRSPTYGDVAWTAADIALLDEARALLGTPRRRQTQTDEADIRSFGHIVVDEAQDLSPMQLRMLSRRSLGGSMTIVGDIAQATGSWAPSSWGQVVEHLSGSRPWRRVELTVNYRTPVEIMDLAGRVLEEGAPGMQPPEAVRTTGDPVRIRAADGSPGSDRDLGSLLVRTAGEELAAVRPGGAEDGSVGVIVAASQLAELSRRMTDAGTVHGTVDGAALDEAITLLAVEDAKGLEFDAVIAVEPARMARESAQGLRSVYVALTRATRRLAVLHAEPLPVSFDAPRPSSVSHSSHSTPVWETTDTGD